MIFRLLIIHNHDRKSIRVLHIATWDYFTSRLPDRFIRSPKEVKEAIMIDINDLVQESWNTSSDGGVGAPFFEMRRLLRLLEILQNISHVCFVIISVFASRGLTDKNLQKANLNFFDESTSDKCRSSDHKFGYHLVLLDGYRKMLDHSVSNIVDSNKLEHSCKPHTYALNRHLLVLPQHLLGTTCWIAAENALQHARNNVSSVFKVFDKWQIQKSEYVVHAGFDESLIKSHVGYLEQIHVFVLREVDATSPLLSELGRLFSPFSSILFTESSSYRLPVFKDDGSIWEFDEITYFTASKFADGGSSSKTPLTIISLLQTTNQADSTSSFPQSSSGSGEGEKNEKWKGKERDMGDKDEADKGSKDDEDPSDDPDNPPGDQAGIIAGPAKISFEIDSEIYPNQDERNVFQIFTMHGSLTITVLLYHYCIQVV